MIAIQDMTCTRVEKKKLKSYSKELRKLSQTIEVQDRALYEQQATLPALYLKPTLAYLTQNPAWYLRKELTDDCIARGGCCSRQCRCCEDRHLHPRWTHGKGIGHCTAECGCCAIHRGYDYTDKEKDEVVSQFERMLMHHLGSFLLTMAEAFFSAPDIPEPESSALSEKDQISAREAFENNKELSKAIYVEQIRALMYNSKEKKEYLWDPLVRFLVALDCKPQ
jgi:hypothetical protein